MRAYYALVDDILSWDEFEEAVYAQTISDDEESEKRAAECVAEKYGRLHPKISGLNRNPTLNSFFCRVIETGPVKEFARPDGSCGLLLRVLAGDETGEAVLVFWDEKAAAASEVAAGDVLEVAGRYKSLSNIIVVDLRRAECEISLRRDGVKTLKPSSLGLYVVEMISSKEYPGKDGSPVFRSVFLGYDSDAGFLRLTVWGREMPVELVPGAAVSIKGAVPEPSYFRSYLVNDKSEVEIVPDAPHPPATTVSDLKPGDFCSVAGEIVDVSEISGYHGKYGKILWLKKGIIADETGEAPFVLWGKNALKPLFRGDFVHIYNCLIKSAGRSFDLEVLQGTDVPEIHAGYNSAADISSEGGCRDFRASGVIVKFPEGTFLVAGEDRYLLQGDDDFACGDEIEVYGVLSGHVLEVKSHEHTRTDISSILEKKCSLKETYLGN